MDISTVARFVEKIGKCIKCNNNLQFMHVDGKGMHQRLTFQCGQCKRQETMQNEAKSLQGEKKLPKRLAFSTIYSGCTWRQTQGIMEVAGIATPLSEKTFYRIQKSCFMRPVASQEMKF